MKTETILIAGGVGAVVLWLCWRNGRKQAFSGVDAVRAGAANGVESLANLISPTCCTSCQQTAAAASSSSTVTTGTVGTTTINPNQQATGVAVSSQAQPILAPTGSSSIPINAGVVSTTNTPIVPLCALQGSNSVPLGIAA